VYHQHKSAEVGLLVVQVSTLPNKPNSRVISKSKETQARAIVSVRNSPLRISEIKNRLERTNGVYEVQIIVPTSNVIVRYDPMVISLDAIRSRLNK